MATNFDYEIITLEAQLCSDYRYIARVGQIVCNKGSEHKVVSWNKHQIPETWGLNEAEAYNKLELEIKRWIATQQ